MSAASVPLSPPTFPPPPTWSEPYAAQSQAREIDRTKTGLLLLVAGSLLGWIPLIGLIGAILVLVGVILVILGRKAFGKAHARNVVLAIVLFLVGIVGAVFVGVSLGLALASAMLPGGSPPTAETIRAAFNTLLWGTVVVTAVASLSSVLITYALQKPLGRMILWGGYAATVAINLAIVFIIAPDVSEAVADAFQGGTFNDAALSAVLNRLNFLNVLTAIPSVLFAAAYYLAWQRVNRREIPERPVPGPMMPAAPLPPRM